MTLLSGIRKTNQKIMQKSHIVEIYGEDHSPWVQSVLLGMHDNNINYNLRAVPTIGLLSKSGMMMPAMRIGRSEWKLDSMEILQTLGYDSVPSLEKKMIFKTWNGCLLYTSPSPRDGLLSRMPSSA